MHMEKNVGVGVKQPPPPSLPSRLQMWVIWKKCRVIVHIQQYIHIYPLEIYIIYIFRSWPLGRWGMLDQVILSIYIYLLTSWHPPSQQTQHPIPVRFLLFRNPIPACPHSLVIIIASLWIMWRMGCIKVGVVVCGGAKHTYADNICAVHI